MKQDTKRIPYGRNDFVQIIEQNNYYVDKTMYLPALEDEAVNLFFIRPRRFGKSVFISMLQAYYDCSMKDKFKDLFGNLWIGKNPTPLQGKYLVLYLDFSQVGGRIDQLEDKFNRYCKVKLDSFVDVYRQYYSEDFVKKVFEAEDAVDKLILINDESKKLHLRNYLSSGKGPEEMIDPNTKTDYNKMKKLIQLDKLDGDRKGVIRTIAEKGEIVTTLYDTFPARMITDPQVFPSLLFYYGMLTIKATRGAKLILGIPNNNVRKQYYEYLIE